MHMLESAMAFAVAMIIFSTIVTGLVEALLRLLALRQKSLGRAIESLLRQEVLPALVKALTEAKKKKTELDSALSKAEAWHGKVSDVIADFTVNPLGDKSAKSSQGWWDRRLGNIDELTTYSFLQRLAKSDLADEITQLDDDRLAAYLANISRTYERYIAASHELYRKWSYVVTTVAAMLFAVAYNVDAGRVYVHLMDDPATRTSLIEQADQAMEENRKAVQSLKVLLGELEEDRDGDPLAEKTESEVLAEIKATRIALNTLREDSRLPVGPSLWPYCMGGDWMACDEDRATTALSLDFAFWVLNVLLAGVLIGLGGPFWSKVYTRLAQLAGRIPGMRGNAELVDDGDDAPPQAKKAAHDPVAAFRIASGDVTVKSAPPPDLRKPVDQTG